MSVITYQSTDNSTFCPRKCLEGRQRHFTWVVESLQFNCCGPKYLYSLGYKSVIDNTPENMYMIFSWDAMNAVTIVRTFQLVKGSFFGQMDCGVTVTTYSNSQILFNRIKQYTRCVYYHWIIWHTHEAVPAAGYEKLKASHSYAYCTWKQAFQFKD